VRLQRPLCRPSLSPTFFAMSDMHRILQSVPSSQIEPSWLRHAERIQRITRFGISHACATCATTSPVQSWSPPEATHSEETLVIHARLAALATSDVAITAKMFSCPNAPR
jgi:hypothetical protein